VSAANITKPIRLTVEREKNPFTGAERYTFRLHDKFHRGVGVGEGATEEEARTSGDSLRKHLEAVS
jgi:hypothetical protein